MFFVLFQKAKSFFFGGAGTFLRYNHLFILYMWIKFCIIFCACRRDKDGLANTRLRPGFFLLTRYIRGYLRNQWLSKILKKNHLIKFVDKLFCLSAFFSMCLFLSVYIKPSLWVLFLFVCCVSWFCKLGKEMEFFFFI